MSKDPYSGQTINLNEISTKPPLNAESIPITKGGKSVDPYTLKPFDSSMSPLYMSNAERGQKALEGLGAPFKSLTDTLNTIAEMHYGKKLNPEESGQFVKNVMTTPLNLVTAPMGAISSSLLASSGLDQLLAKKYADTIPKDAQPYTSAALEILGTLGAKGDLSPVDIKKIDIKNVANGLNMGKGLLPGKLAEEEVMPAIQAYKDKINSEVYQPMRDELSTVKTPYFVGKSAAREINAYADNLKASGKLNPNEEKMLRGVADDVSQWNTLDTLLNRRQAYDRQFASLYPESSDIKNINFADKLALDTRNIITKEIRNGILKSSPEGVKLNADSNNQALLDKFDNANEMYAEKMDNLDKLANAIKKTPEKFFENGIIQKGLNTQRALTDTIGQPLVSKNAYQYLADKVIDANGQFRSAQFKQFMNKMPEEVGQQIFGNDWAEMKQLESAVNRRLDEGLGRIAKKSGGVLNAAQDLLVDQTLKRMLQGKATYDLTTMKFNPSWLATGAPAVSKEITKEGQK